MVICTVEGCQTERKNLSSPYCEKHRSRVRRHGDPNIVLKDHTPAIERWKYSYTVNEHTGCWVWNKGGEVATGGYGGISNGLGNYTAAHKFVYEQLVGPVPEGLELDHLCEIKACVNPEHLELVTHSVNVRRGNASRRSRLAPNEHDRRVRETMQKRRAGFQADPTRCNACGAALAGTFFKTCEGCRSTKREAYARKQRSS